MRKLLGPADLLSLMFLAFLAGLAVLSGAATASTGLLPLYGTLAVSIGLAGAYRHRSGTGNKGPYLSTAVAVLTVLMVFNSLGGLIPRVRQHRYDEVLIGIDHALFGVHPTVWMERWIDPSLTTLLMAGYLSYYLMPVSTGIMLVARGRYRDFEHALFGILLCFYFSYVGYLLVPAVGPRFTLADVQTTGLQAGPVTVAIQDLLNRLEQNKTDAFPSGHTAVALVSLWYALRAREKLLSAVLLPAVVLLIISTVYLRYHYVIDVIAGVMLAGLTAAVAPFLERLLSGTAGEDDDQGHGRT